MSIQVKSRTGTIHVIDTLSPSPERSRLLRPCRACNKVFFSVPWQMQCDGCGEGVWVNEPKARKDNQEVAKAKLKRNKLAREKKKAAELEAAAAEDAFLKKDVKLPDCLPSYLRV